MERDTTSDELPALGRPDNQDQWTMYQLSSSGKREPGQREYYARVWARPSSLANVIARSIENFNEYYGTRYVVDDVVVVQEP